MDKQFDELSKSLAEGVSRRQALRKFGVGLAGALLAAIGLSASTRSDGARRCKNSGQHCVRDYECCFGFCNKSGNNHGTCA